MRIVRLIANSTLALLASILVSMPTFALAQTAAPGAPVSAAAGVIDASVADYKLGSGDKIRLTIYGEPSLSGEFFVSGSGMTSLPLIGDVKATGLTVREFQDAVQKSLSDGYLREPRVSAEVLNFRPFYILGEVTKPGTYPYTSGLTVLNAVATAGGYTYRAEKKQVYIKHDGQTSETRVSLDPSTTVAPGDTIRIGERFF
jgi:protein involved in polysaccharide export with SLBB domain